MSRLLEILKELAFEKKEVTLASGRKSNFYINVKRVSLTAEGSVLIGEELLQLIREKHPDAVAIGGLTLGADPLATAVAYTSWLQKQPLGAFIVRKESKGYGLSRVIEGIEGLAPKSKVVILEDVVTSGKSSLEAAIKAQEANLDVVGIAAIVDRQEGGSESLKDAGFTLSSLYQKRDFGIFDE